VPVDYAVLSVAIHTRSIFLSCIQMFSYIHTYVCLSLLLPCYRKNGSWGWEENRWSRKNTNQQMTLMMGESALIVCCRSAAFLFRDIYLLLPLPGYIVELLSSCVELWFWTVDTYVVMLNKFPCVGTGLSLNSHWYTL